MAAPDRFSRVALRRAIQERDLAGQTRLICRNFWIMLSSGFWKGRAFFLLGGWRLAEWVIFPAKNGSVRQNALAGGLGTASMITWAVNFARQSYVTPLSEIYVNNLSECIGRAVVNNVPFAASAAGVPVSPTFSEAGLANGCRCGDDKSNAARADAHLVPPLGPKAAANCVLCPSSRGVPEIMVREVAGGLSMEPSVLELAPVAARSSPTRKLLKMVLLFSLKEGAQEICFDPGESDIRLSYKVNGIEMEMVPPPRHLYRPLANLVKALAGIEDRDTRHSPMCRIRRWFDRQFCQCAVENGTFPEPPMPLPCRPGQFHARLGGKLVDISFSIQLSAFGPRIDLVVVNPVAGLATAANQALEAYRTSRPEISLAELEYPL